MSNFYKSLQNTKRNVKMEQQLKRQVIFTEEKAKRYVNTVEMILSRHFGTEIKVTSYQIVPNRNNSKKVV